MIRGLSAFALAPRLDVARAALSLLIWTAWKHRTTSGRRTCSVLISFPMLIAASAHVEALDAEQVFEKSCRQHRDGRKPGRSRDNDAEFAISVMASGWPACIDWFSRAETPSSIRRPEVPF